MKIACIGAGWYPQTPGGLEKYVYGMVHEAVRDGDDVDLFVTGQPVSWDPRARVTSLADPAAPLWRRARSARAGFAKNYREPYDVLNIHFAMNALPLLPFISHRTLRVVHFHGPWAAESRAEGGGLLGAAVKAALERFVYRSADRLITLSTAFKQILVDEYGIDARRIAVVPMGIDTTFFHPAADRPAVRAELGWQRDATVFFTARRLVNRVGLMELIEAAAIAREAQSNFVLKIAGRGPLREQLERAITEHKLNDCVELLGFVSEEGLVHAYQAADWTILPTQSLEGFGTIISESLACGTPVIVTPVGGMPEAVAPLDPQLIASGVTPNHIAERMRAVLDGSLVGPDTATCRAYAEEHYDWRAVWQRIRTVFRGDVDT